MKTLGMSLMIIMVLSFLSVIFGNTFIGGTQPFVYDNTLIVNGSASTLGINDSESIFGIDTITGLLTLIITITTFVSLIGIQVLGSGLNDSTVRTLTIITFFGGIWGIFSILAFGLIVSIETFGSLIYVALTIAYVYGVAQKIAGGTE